MSGISDSSERRQFKRYILKKGVYAVDTARPGLIEEISLGGMSLCYIDRKNWPEDNYCLDIVFGDDENFRLNKLPYRIVSDHETNDGNCTELKK